MNPELNNNQDMSGEQSIPEETILGVKVNVLTMDRTIQKISEWVENQDPHYVCCVPAHSIMDCVAQHNLRKVFLNSGLCTPDGMAVVWLLKWRGHPQVERVYGPDLFLAVCRAGLDRRWRHYFFGGAAGTGQKLAGFVQQKFPGIEVAGWESPPFREMSEEEKVDFKKRMAALKPDVLWVAVGSPKQEIWMSEWVNQLDIPVLVGVGAAFDFLTGQKKQAPEWMQNIGLEWFFRLLT